MRYLERMILARKALGRAPIQLCLSFLRSFRQKCPLRVGVVRSAIAARLDASSFSSSLQMLYLVLWSDRGHRSSISRVLLSGSRPPWRVDAFLKRVLVGILLRQNRAVPWWRSGFAAWDRVGRCFVGKPLAVFELAEFLTNAPAYFPSSVCNETTFVHFGFALLSWIRA
jgi:hypothetical protein